MTLPNTTTRRLPDWQRERLECWLAEWEIVETMPETGGDEWEGGPEPVPGWVAPREGSSDPDEREPVRPGDVRLLYPAAGERWRRPVYVAVVSAESPERVLAAPFGPFAEPAVPGELLLRGLAPGIRVLCLWNCREMNRDSLKASWLVARLAVTDLDRVLAVRGHVDGGRALPEAVARDVGPPLAHPLDPRHEYLARQRLTMDALVRECRAGSGAAGRGGTLYLERPRSELLLAAEDRPTYGALARYSVPGYALRLIVVSLRAGEAELRVSDSRQRLSAELDGGCVRLPDGRLLPALQDGRTSFPPGAVGPGLLLVFPDGTALPLTPA